MRLKTITILFILVLCSLGNILAGEPDGYYSSTKDLSGEALKAALNDIIKGHKKYTYTSSATKDTWDILKETDIDPNNGDNVILFYSGRSVNGAQEYNSAKGWSRDHVWPQSRGDFNTNRGIGTDLHNLKPVSIPVNSAKNDRWMDVANPGNSYVFTYTVNNVTISTGSKICQSQDVWEPRDEDKGDVARILFYMATRYEGENGELDLELVKNVPASGGAYMGNIYTLLEWNREDPPDDFERHRNDVIYSYQKNRNPFIDHPEFANLIWKRTIKFAYDDSGNRISRTLGTIIVSTSTTASAETSVSAKAAIASTSTTDSTKTQPRVMETAINEEVIVKIYPNPTKGKIQLDVVGITNWENSAYQIYDSNGIVIRQASSVSATQQIDLLDASNGIYILCLSIDGKQYQWKIIKQ